MAKFSFTGLDSIQDQLKDRGAKVGGTINHMLNAGAKIVREEMKAAMKEYKLKDSGDLIKSVKSSKIQRTANGRSISISPQGIDRKGVPNAAKAAVYQTGNSKHQARPWLTLAIERSQGKVQERMREIFNEEMSKAGGGEGEWDVTEE